MKKRELQAGIIAGMLWLWWIIFMLDPQMLRFCVQNIDMMITPLRLELIGPPAATVILVLGLLVNRKTIVGSGCLAIIGFDVLWLFRTKPFALVFTGTRGLLTIAHLAEALAFLMLLLLLVRQEKPGVRILAASILALAGQIPLVMGGGYPRILGNSELFVPGLIMYLLAVTATGMYCAGLRPEMLNGFFGKSRGADGLGSKYGSSANSRRGGASGEKDLPKIPETMSEEKKERIRNLKALRDNGLMSREEYNEMVEKIKRS